MTRAAVEGRVVGFALLVPHGCGGGVSIALRKALEGLAAAKHCSAAGSGALLLFVFLLVVAVLGALEITLTARRRPYSHVLLYDRRLVVGVGV